MCFAHDAHPPIRPIGGASFNTDRITLTAGDGNEFMAYGAQAGAPASPAIVVMPDVRGLFPFYEELAERFAERGFDIAAIFDRDPEKIGQPWNGHAVRDISELEAALTAEPVEIAVITTPADAAQAVADRLVAVGVKASLHFAPVKLDVPDDVTVKTVNLALELEVLSYALTDR